MFVAELPADVQEDELTALFKDVSQWRCSLRVVRVLTRWLQCGSIREIKITHLPNSFVATVEFMERVSATGDTTSL